MSASVLPTPHAVHASGRNAVVIGSVVLLHALALWALNDGLLRAPPEVVVPARILTELIAPPAPAAAPAPVPAVAAPQHAPPAVRPRATPEPAPRARATTQASAAPQPRPVHVPDATPTAATAPTTPVSPVTAPSPVSVQANDPAVAATPAPAPAPAAAAAPPPAPAPAPAAAVVVQPSSSAAYLNNPRPEYPAMSKRLGETGRVVVRVLIGPDGRAQEARIQRSSGFDRLDQVALETARDRWRYVPGTRGGVPEAMWFNVPINFVLE